jgi:hypothetical protein
MKNGDGLFGKCIVLVLRRPRFFFRSSGAADDHLQQSAVLCCRLPVCPQQCCLVPAVVHFDAPLQRQR